MRASQVPDQFKHPDLHINSWLQVLQLARTQLKNRVAARRPERVYIDIHFGILQYIDIHTQKNSGNLYRSYVYLLILDSKCYEFAAPIQAMRSGLTP